MSEEITSRVLIYCINRDLDLMREVYTASQAKRGIIILGQEKMYSPVGYLNNKPELKDTFECLMEEPMADNLEGIQADIYDFEEMMRLLYRLTEKIKNEGDEVYISIVGGSGEYSSAASIIGMMEEDVTILGAKISDKRLTVLKNDATSEYYNHQVTSCVKINKIDLTGPDDTLLTALDVFSRIKSQKRSSTNVIKALIEDGIWYKIKDIGTPEYKYQYTSLDPNIEAGKDKRGHPKDADGMRKDLQSNEKNVYQRHLITKWEKLGWIKYDDRTAAKYSHTDKGNSLLYIFKEPVDFDKCLLPVNMMDVEFEQEEEDIPAIFVDMNGDPL